MNDIYLIIVRVEKLQKERKKLADVTSRDYEELMEK